ncbi:MAG: polyhydroxybutyrate depolymerase [Proteobacteria bacterium]|nr:polyhydroxybutyrate depolymerase [Pseudomonadota bacterium]
MMRIVRFFLYALVGLAASIGALFFYFLYSPTPDIPQLSGTMTRQTMQVDGLERIYRLYVPKALAKGAPLVVVMHGSGENGAQIRLGTGYEFDRLADLHRFAVVYPYGFEGYWNACNKVGDYAANTRNIDDVKFLTVLVDKLAHDIGIDTHRVFATGVSRGGHMAYRLALEAPQRFRAVAAVSASVPTPDNFKCKPASTSTSSVLIINGTKDPLNPFEGGEVQIFGLIARGTVLSSRASGQYFADLNHITGAPATRTTQAADGIRVEQTLWHDDSKPQIELLAIDGGGHGMPQPYYRNPRILGPTAKEPNGPDAIWAFFAQQSQR